MSVLLDAGPTLNFLAVGQQTVLIAVADKGGLQLTVPQRVDREVLGMCKDPRFARTPAQATWRKLKGAGRVVVVTDELATAVFTEAVTRVSGVPARERVRSSRSLGEIMVWRTRPVWRRAALTCSSCSTKATAATAAAASKGGVSGTAGPGGWSCGRPVRY